MKSNSFYFCLFLFFGAVSPSDVLASPDKPLSENTNCLQDVRKGLKNLKFGPSVEQFSGEDLGTLCEAGEAKLAVSCVKTVASSRKNMRPLGIATVCSGGTSGNDALACLSAMEKKTDRWFTTVDSCTGVARQASACVGATNGLSCTGPSISTTAAESLPRTGSQ